MSPAAGPDLSMFNRFAKSFRKGDIIFCEYEPGDTFYLIQAGRVQVVRIIGDLEKRFPGIKERICDEKGAVRRFVNIFVKDEDIRFQQNLETPVAESDEVSIVPAIAGG